MPTPQVATERRGRSFMIRRTWNGSLRDCSRLRAVPRRRMLGLRSSAQYIGVHQRIQRTEAQRIAGKEQQHSPTQALLSCSLSYTAASHVMSFRFVFGAILVPAFLFAKRAKKSRTTRCVPRSKNFFALFSRFCEPLLPLQVGVYVTFNPPPIQNAEAGYAGVCGLHP